MRRYPIACLAVLCFAAVLIHGPTTADAQVLICGSDAVLKDVQNTLLGSIEVTNLRVTWTTSNESADLDHYEIWRRAGDLAVRLLVVRPEWKCPMPSRREVVVPFDLEGDYWLELHVRDRSQRAVVIPLS